MGGPGSFEQLLSEAEREPFQGWDFSYVHERMAEESSPWDYCEIVRESLRRAESVIDLGTGGGELLSSLGPLPRRAFATEGYLPNLPVARRRLRPLGVELVATFCDDNTKSSQKGALPFRSNSVDLVINRHEAFVADEICRVLRRPGKFVTEQVGDACHPELFAALGLATPTDSSRWNLQTAAAQLAAAGLHITSSREALLETRFMDVGAVAYYSKAVVPLWIPGFSPDGYRDRLREIHEKIQKEGSFRITIPCFFVQAEKD